MDHKELDEYMEALWYLSETAEPDVERLKLYIKEVFNAAVVDELQSQKWIRVTADEKIEFTPRGYDQAKQIVRCHRLAERLLADVLGMQPQDAERGACDFEHVLVPEVADSICTLLGHPRECPHGLNIPEGNCCRAAHSTLQSAIVPLDNVEVGVQVKVSYIKTASNSRMHKLAHFGIIPGAAIRVHQRYPSFVLECGNTQIAMEEDVAREVFVLYPGGAGGSGQGHRKRRRWRRKKI
ncbi:MAG: metal-dependent transcriptional regulator [Deltaproteobacteria bacterium]|nr:metal-dependent transcriptional regulator [Deltaproteobacteria bacterium]